MNEKKLTINAPVQQTVLHFLPLSLIDSNSLAMVSSSSPRLIKEKKITSCKKAHLQVKKGTATVEKNTFTSCNKQHIQL
jgi:hypothetical protein